MPHIPFNLVAPIVAALAAMVIGSVWYSPLLFMKVWMKEAGLDRQDEACSKEGAAKAMAGQLVTSLIMAYVLAMSLGM